MLDDLRIATYTDIPHQSGATRAWATRNDRTSTHSKALCQRPPTNCSIRTLASALLEHHRSSTSSMAPKGPHGYLNYPCCLLPVVAQRYYQTRQWLLSSRFTDFSLFFFFLQFIFDFALCIRAVHHQPGVRREKGSPRLCAYPPTRSNPAKPPKPFPPHRSSDPHSPVATFHYHGLRRRRYRYRHRPGAAPEQRPTPLGTVDGFCSSTRREKRRPFPRRVAPPFSGGSGRSPSVPRGADAYCLSSM